MRTPVAVSLTVLILVALSQTHVTHGAGGLAIAGGAQASGCGVRS